MIKRWFLVHIGFPAVVLSGRILAHSVCEKFERWVVERNNRSLENFCMHSCHCVLLLLPHCIQFDECSHRLTGTILNCAGCGKCRISDLLTLGEKYNIIMKVATGGRLAKRIVNEISPDVVIAVACERELCEGIFSVYPLPVYGIPNIRLSGPCINTTVDVNSVEKVLKDIFSRIKK